MRHLIIPLLAGWTTVLFSQDSEPPFLNSDQPPPGAASYVSPQPESAGKHLQNSLVKLREGFDPPRPFRIWALGSSYTNMLGNGEVWQEALPKRFPNTTEVHYTKMIGNACPWQYLLGWVQTLVVPDPPDLVVIYTLGDPADLDRLITEIRQRTTADVLVASIHWRMRDEPNWGVNENAVDQDVEAVREVCRKHAAEFVENRRAWGDYLKAQQLPIANLLKDPVHQSPYGASIINQNLLSHFQPGTEARQDDREVQVDPDPSQPLDQQGSRMELEFTGNRIELIGRAVAGGGKASVLIDGIPAAQFPVFLPTYIQGDSNNARHQRGDNPRDLAPHGVRLGDNCIPQQWTIVMTDDEGGYQLTGSATGKDGEGNAFEDFTSISGQITLPARLWRRAERNRKGDRFTFEVVRSTLSEIDFSPSETQPEGSLFRIRLANDLANTSHTLTLVAHGDGPVAIERFDVFRPRLGRQP